MPDQSADAAVFDVDTASFEARVINASRERPIVVDFWAPWCAPCKALGPVLERVITETAGRAALAKVNVDENQQLAAAFGVRGIPAVKVFKDGKLAAQFEGALPEAEVRRIIEKLVPSAGDETAAEAAQALESGSADEAEQRFRQVLEQEPGHSGALVGLAAIALDRGDHAEARDFAEKVEAGTPEHAQAAALLARLDFADRAREIGGTDAARAKADADETDLDARYDLAVCLAADGDYQAALDELLAILTADKHWRDGRAKDAMVRIFGIVGQRSDLADDYRQRLAQLLY